MISSLVLPQSAANLIETTAFSGRNPGLQLDKYSPPGDQRAQRDAIELVCKATGDPEMHSALLRRRDSMLMEAAALRFRATTCGPLTLHLARAAGLENAGIYLHPVYGFACLPGSGLKGMARAYAETVWLLDQVDKAEAWRRIQSVFGWVGGSDRKRWRPSDVEEAKGSAAGAVVFHEAWPTVWPNVEPDITNSHHTNYYQGKDDPGDWEGPVPVSFLAIGAGVTFDFGIAARTEMEQNLADDAATWLQAALVHAGVGAKTNAGYGRFVLEDLPEPAAPVAARRIAQHQLTLATPAFLAGARQEAGDCALRPATLRGLLRWWWRTMHSGHLGADALRQLETAIWGDARTGAALSLAVRPIGDPAVRLFDYKDRFQPKPDFQQAHDLERPQRGAKTTQGLFYASYGMDEMSRGDKQQRWYVEPGAAWTVTLSARRTIAPGDIGELSAAVILKQAEAALWLLTRHGAAGSKARKGFGAFADLTISGIGSVDDCKAAAIELRHSCSLPAGRVDASSIDEMIVFEADTPWSDPWFAMDQVGFAYQETVKDFREDADRAALGLPRMVGRRPGRPLKVGRIDRHASPLHWSLSPDGNGALSIRLTAFPAARLPDLDKSRSILEDAVSRSGLNIKERTKQHARRGREQRHGRVAQASPHPTSPQQAQVGLPPNGEETQAVLLEERTKKGSWRARHVGSGLVGTIENSGSVPEDALAGTTIPLLVVNRTNFLWPDEAARARFAKRQASRPAQSRRGRR